MRSGRETHSNDRVTGIYGGCGGTKQVPGHIDYRIIKIQGIVCINREGERGTGKGPAP